LILVLSGVLEAIWAADWSIVAWVVGLTSAAHSYQHENEPLWQYLAVSVA
jgi:hypothetical protein